MELFKNFQKIEGPGEWFTGDVELEYLFNPIEESGRTSGALVTFQPGARTAWHTHPLGQTLIVTSGKGWVQVEGEKKYEITKGDVVQFAPGEKHWHGATDSTEMSHYAIQEAKDDKAIDWLEQVSDEDYLS